LRAASVVAASHPNAPAPCAGVVKGASGTDILGGGLLTSINTDLVRCAFKLFRKGNEDDGHFGYFAFSSCKFSSVIFLCSLQVLRRYHPSMWFPGPNGFF
jgi:hypothetical protein